MKTLRSRNAIVALVGVFAITIVAIIILTRGSHRPTRTEDPRSMAGDTVTTVAETPAANFSQEEISHQDRSGDRPVLQTGVDLLQKINVQTEEAVFGSLDRKIRTTGQFAMDEQGTHSVALKIDGWVEKLYVDFDGAMVQKGQPILELYSPGLITSQEEYLLALRSAERLGGTSSESDARHLVDAARRRLEYWDLSAEQIRHLEEINAPSRTLTFYAPASGEVMNKSVTSGQFIKAGQSLFNIVDVSKIWLIVDVYEQDVPWVKIGTDAVIELPSQPGQRFHGKVDYVFHMMNNELRTARARIVLPGRHGGPFKPGMFATATLEIAATSPTIVVPENALIRTGQREMVLVALGDGKFMPKYVVAGYSADNKTQILEGLEKGDEVVTRAQFLIDSEAQIRGVISAIDTSAAGSPPESSITKHAQH